MEELIVFVNRLIVRSLEIAQAMSIRPPWFVLNISVKDYSMESNSIFCFHKTQAQFPQVLKKGSVLQLFCEWLTLNDLRISLEYF